MPLVNHTYKSLSQGVSQQHTEARYESQVDEMVNCIPDISRGIFRRNPFTSIASINDTTFNSNPNFFTYAYDRGDNEKYILQVNNNNTLNVLNYSTGATVSSLTSSYLTVPTDGNFPNVYDSFTALTVGDFTFIVNKNKEVAMDATVSNGVDNDLNTAIYWIKDVTTIEISSSTQGTTSSTVTAANYEGYTYTLNGVSVQAKREYTYNATTEEFDLTLDRVSAEDIATELATQLGANYASAGPFVYWIGTGAPTTWDWSDSFMDQASLGWQGKVADAADLPATLSKDMVDYYTTNFGMINVYITGGTEDNIGYWLEYEANIGWKEGRKPGLKNSLDASTMPHVLVRGSDGNFYFKEYTTTALQTVPGLEDTDLGWKERKVGDLETSKEPAFVGQAINDIFFYQNRLSFIAKSSVLFSGVSDYGNFFPTSIRAFVESDVIDLTVASQEVPQLRYAIELADRLIIFSDTTQFLVTSTEGPLSPSTAIISVGSKYNILPRCKPIVVGDSAYFVSAIGTSEHLYKYSLSDKVTDKFVATDVTLHTPTYLQSNTVKLVGHSTLGYILMFEYGSNSIYVLNNTIMGEELVQTAIHKWELPQPVIGLNILDNSLYISLYNGTDNKIVLGTISLDSPVDYTTINYTDVVDTVPFSYDSYLDLSEWQIKEEGFGTSRGRLQIKTILYSIDEDSTYMTTLTNKDLAVTTFESLIKNGVWDDTLYWNDAAPWSDTGYKFSRYYYNDEKITVMGNAKRTLIRFGSNDTDTTKGFNLKTINYEGFFYQRSQKY